MTVTRLLERKDAVRHLELERIHTNIDRHGIDLVRGDGRLVDPHTVEVTPADGDATRLTADVILVATGSSPVPPARRPVRRRGRPRRRRDPADPPPPAVDGRDRRRGDRLRVRVHVRGAGRAGAPDRPAARPAPVPGRGDGGAARGRDALARDHAAPGAHARARLARARWLDVHAVVGRAARRGDRDGRGRPSGEHRRPRPPRDRRRGRRAWLRQGGRGLPDGGRGRLRGRRRRRLPVARERLHGAGPGRRVPRVRVHVQAAGVGPAAVRRLHDPGGELRRPGRGGGGAARAWTSWRDARSTATTSAARS